MKACTATGRNEAGFLLIEAVIAVALIAICAGAALAAAAAVTHATARTVGSAALMLSAQNVLTDLRAATAYDPLQLSELAGKTAVFDAGDPPAAGSSRRIHFITTVQRDVATGTYIGSVTARGVDGTVVTMNTTLAVAAPAPGAIVPANTPLVNQPAAVAGDLDQINL